MARTTKKNNMILVGDVGGTNTRLALVEVGRDGGTTIRHRGKSKNAGRSGFTDIVHRFLRSGARDGVRLACFGVAGPVRDGSAELTNLHWKFGERELARDLKLDRVILVNDLVAHAEGIPSLGPNDRVTIHQGKPEPTGNRVILAPGTGLGEAGLVFDDCTDEYRGCASEGGHCDFSPTDEREDALMHFVRGRTGGRCSWEDVLCGPGLRVIWDFLTTSKMFHVEHSLPTDDPEPAQITAAANSRKCKACVAAVEMFAALCGAEGGNLALKFLATGGLYLGGGIPQHILKFLRSPGLRAAFCRKGPENVNEILRAIPIHVLVSDDTALLGAARFALRRGRRSAPLRVPARRGKRG